MKEIIGHTLEFDVVDKCESQPERNNLLIKMQNRIQEIIESEFGAFVVSGRGKLLYGESQDNGLKIIIRQVGSSTYQPYIEDEKQCEPAKENVIPRCYGGYYSFLCNREKGKCCVRESCKLISKIK